VQSTKEKPKPICTANQAGLFFCAEHCAYISRPQNRGPINLCKAEAPTKGMRLRSPLIVIGLKEGN
jgi:hypothetical protein